MRSRSPITLDLALMVGTSRCDVRVRVALGLLKLLQSLVLRHSLARAAEALREGACLVIGHWLFSQL
jgi:hypothetical protein